ncbi:hypothetical protein MMC09_005179 [Bachmanniomyces sp. S44760]|nr:hypothetical protein [Bachmanniomyces sp. S44760]
MPGRQSTGPLTRRNRATKRRPKKHSLNALAVASQQNPEHVKIRRHRLGEDDSDEIKRKRYITQDGTGNEGDLGPASKRRKPSTDRYGADVETGSDSEGNEWKIGHVDSNDDSDLDSDEAMGASDEERFEAYTFRGSSTTKIGQDRSRRGSMANGGAESSRELELNESLNDGAAPEHSSDDLGEDAIDLAAVLDQSDGDSVDKDEEWSDLTGEGQRSGDEDSVNDELSVLSVSEEDENDNAARLSALQNLVSSIDARDDSSRRRPHPVTTSQEASVPSEYGVNPRQKLTVADLLPTVNDPQLKKSLKLLTDHGKSSDKARHLSKKLDVPLAKRQQDRLDRSAAYEKSKETLNRWIDTIKHNRRADHLSFPLQDPDAASAKNATRLLPTSYSKPLTNLETTIQNILIESGLAPVNNRSEEDQLQAFEELQTNEIPIEEVQARRAELRKARELLFREEIRSKRIKKIKSKSYRRVHRREREKNNQRERDALVAAGVEPSEDEGERDQRRRAEERMGSRHRESKWAKGVKDSGRATWDGETRDGVAEMARRDEELRRRIEGKYIEGPEDDSFTDTDTDTDENQDSGIDGRVGGLRRQLDRLESDNGATLANEDRGGLLSMKFMKSAEATREKNNNAELQRIRRELDGEDSGDDDDHAEKTGRRSYGPFKARDAHKINGNLPRNEFEENLGSENEDRSPILVHDEHVDMVVGNSPAAPSIKRPRPALSSISRSKQHATEQESPSRDFKDNPWLFGAKADRSNSKKRTNKSQDESVLMSNNPGPHTIDSSIKPGKAARVFDQQKRRKNPNPESDANGDGDDDDDDGDSSFEGFEIETSTFSKNSPNQNRNTELIREAFAGDSVFEDFAQEKKETIIDEEEKLIDNTLPGWGSWTGTGLSKKAQAQARNNKNKNRDRNKVMTKIEGIRPEKRADARSDRVIINEKRMRKNAKYLASTLPHPFETRQQYERSLRLPVGPEWTTKETFQNATKPRVLLKQGVIEPMERPLV